MHVMLYSRMSMMSTIILILFTVWHFYNTVVIWRQSVVFARQCGVFTTPLFLRDTVVYIQHSVVITRQ